MMLNHLYVVGDVDESIVDVFKENLSLAAAVNRLIQLLIQIKQE